MVLQSPAGHQPFSPVTRCAGFLTRVLLQSRNNKMHGSSGRFSRQETSKASAGLSFRGGNKGCSQTKGVGNRHILCPTVRSSRINECLEIGCKCKQTFLLAVVSTLWSAAATTRASKMKYSCFPVISHSCIHPHPLHLIYF